MNWTYKVIFFILETINTSIFFIIFRFFFCAQLNYWYWFCKIDKRVMKMEVIKQSNVNLQNHTLSFQFLTRIFYALHFCRISLQRGGDFVLCTLFKYKPFWAFLPLPRLLFFFFFFSNSAFNLSSFSLRRCSFSILRCFRASSLSFFTSWERSSVVSFGFTSVCSFNLEI